MADIPGPDDAFGALVQFFVREGTLGDTLLHVAQLACLAGPADMAGITMNENLNQAMQSRATIDHAVGIVMATGGKTSKEAFQVLVRASQRENRKLREIAEEIVARVEASRRPTETS